MWMFSIQEFFFSSSFWLHSNIGPKVCKLASQIRWCPFSALGQIQGHKVQHLLVTWARLNFFFITTLTLSVKPLGLILIFAPIGMLDLS
jgi:hypothetical protein